MSITNRITGDQKISGFVNIYNQNNENIENALKEYKDDYKKLDSEIRGKFDNELKKLKNNLTSDVTNLNQRINEYKENLEEIKSGFQSKVEEQISSVVEDFRNEYKNDIDNIKDDVQSNIDDKIINSKNEVLSSVEDDLKEYDDKLDNVKNDINSNIETLGNKHDKDVKDISDNFKGLQGRIETVEKKCISNKSDINSINSQIFNLSDLFEFKSNTESRSNEIDKRLDGVQSTIDNLQNSVQGVQTVALNELKELRTHVKDHVYSYFKEDEGIKETIKESLDGVKDEYIKGVQQTIENFKNDIDFENFEYVLITCQKIDDCIRKLDILKKYHDDIPDDEWNKGTQGVQS